MEQAQLVPHICRSQQMWDDREPSVLGGQAFGWAGLWVEQAFRPALKDRNDWGL